MKSNLITASASRLLMSYLATGFLFSEALSADTQDQSNYFHDPYFSVKSGAIKSAEQFHYGKFIARMKAPLIKGTVSAFFTYWDSNSESSSILDAFDPHHSEWNEIDFEVVPSIEKSPLSMNVIYADGSGEKKESHDYKGFDSTHREADGWHIYELVWTPDFISYRLDNKEIRRIEKKEDESVSHSSRP